MVGSLVGFTKKHCALHCTHAPHRTRTAHTAHARARAARTRTHMHARTHAPALRTARARARTRRTPPATCTCYICPVYPNTTTPARISWHRRCHHAPPHTGELLYVRCGFGVSCGGMACALCLFAYFTASRFGTCVLFACVPPFWLFGDAACTAPAREQRRSFAFVRFLPPVIFAHHDILVMHGLLAFCWHDVLTAFALYHRCQPAATFAPLAWFTALGMVLQQCALAYFCCCRCGSWFAHIFTRIAFL